jgi:hypothetical protein
MTDRHDTAPVVVTDCDHANLDPEHAVLAPHGIALRREQCHTAADVAARCRGAWGACAAAARCACWTFLARSRSRSRGAWP